MLDDILNGASHVAKHDPIVAEEGNVGRDRILDGVVIDLHEDDIGDLLRHLAV